MISTRNLMKAVTAGILIFCLSLSGCAAKPSDSDTESGNSEVVEPGGEPTPSPSLAPSLQPDDMEAMREALIPDQVIPEGREIVTLGIFNAVRVSSPTYKAVEAFNQSQEKYFVKIEVYYSYRRFLLDVARKQGTDLYSLYWGVNAETLAGQGILEDLTPYFERSDAVSREDIVDAVWRAGSVDDKFYFLIPCFSCSGILVEKGYTEKGAWSGKDYLELGKKYQGSMLNQYIQDPSSQILSQLREYMAAFISWEDRTCSFDGDEFIALLEDLKALGTYNYEAVDEHATRAELIREKIYLTELVSFGMDKGMYQYRDIGDAFGDNYEIAGMPTADGSLKYGMNYYDQIYGMNAGAENKEGAWAFLEYLLSEEYQQPDQPDPAPGQKSMLEGLFPARKDALERGLQANIEHVTDPDDTLRVHTNMYSDEKTTEGYEGFTEEDRQAVLYMIDHTYRQSFDNVYTVLNILLEETEPFFLGQKTAEDVVKIIQSKVSLYLME